jgi:glycosyltransferase involved in cell wall biosynthesis
MINLFFVVHDYSGARTYANELLGFLAKQQGIFVHKVLLNSSVFKEYSEIKEADIVSIYIPPPKHNNNSFDKYFKRCIDLMSQRLKGKENLIFHLNNNTQVTLGIEARNRFGARLIYTLHFLPNCFSYFAGETKKSDNLSTTGDEFEKQINYEVEHIITVTHFAKECIKEWYKIPENKITAIHNGLDVLNCNNTLTLKEKVRIKKNFGFDKKDKIILFVGKLEYRKGVKHLVRSFNILSRKVPYARLVILGNGDYNKAFNYVTENWGKITFTGEISQSKVFQFYDISDIGVIPSVYEQCSYVALEMMQHGLPVVVAKAPGLIELYEDRKNALLVSIKNINRLKAESEISEVELEKSIEILLTNELLRKEIATNTKNIWVKNYTAEHMGQATLSVYRKLITKKVRNK